MSPRYTLIISDRESKQERLRERYGVPELYTQKLEHEIVWDVTFPMDGTGLRKTGSARHGTSRVHRDYQFASFYPTNWLFNEPG